MPTSIMINRKTTKLVQDRHGSLELGPTVTTSSFLGGIKNSMGLITPILPPGTVLYGKKHKTEFAVIQEEPGPRTINWLGRTYRVSFPFVVLGITYLDNNYVECDIYYRNDSIRSINDDLCLTNLLNVNSSQSCLGINRLVFKNIAEAIHRVRKAFWEHNFNLGLGSYSDVLGRMSDIEYWAKQTKKNPLCALEVRWPKAGLTVKQMVERLLSYDSDKSVNSINKLTFGDLTVCFDNSTRTWAG